MRHLIVNRLLLDFLQKKFHMTKPAKLFSCNYKKWMQMCVIGMTGRSILDRIIATYYQKCTQRILKKSRNVRNKKARNAFVHSE